MILKLSYVNVSEIFSYLFIHIIVFVWELFLVHYIISLCGILIFLPYLIYVTTDGLKCWIEETYCTVSRHHGWLRQVYEPIWQIVGTVTIALIHQLPPPFFPNIFYISL